ncbi:MAG: NADH:flavin oxidoreductase/NADH oxidase [Turicibacter sp.]|nr:NADH:flavin oxidoreductase/NADH oxidase [Turicibacter sp.]
MGQLMESFELKGMQLKNRVVLPPMCQFNVKNKDGVPTAWHELHYASRAVGGTGLIIVEMSNVEPDGRITDFCLGLWNEEQAQGLGRIVSACHEYGAKVAVQIGHAGRKAEGAEVPVAPSAIAFDEKSKTPRALSTEEIKGMVQKFQEAVARAVSAGVDAIEIHGAHGYLIHQFHSPLTNKREDGYGKDLTLFGREVLKAAKAVMPASMPLMMRISATEYAEGGYTIDDAIGICRAYQQEGVDLFHITSGGEAPLFGSRGLPGSHAGYQVPMARKIKEAIGIPVIAVGKLDDAQHANAIIGNEDADLVAVGRAMLKNPNWALEASVSLNQKTEVPGPLGVVFNVR